MTYYGAKELAEAFRTVRKNTIIIAEEIPEQHYGFQATPETRTVAQTLVHIAAAQKMPEQIHAIERREHSGRIRFSEPDEADTGRGADAARQIADRRAAA